MFVSAALDSHVRIGVILASTWRARRGESFAKWILGMLAQRQGVEAELLDLRDYRLPAYECEELPPAIDTHFTNETTRRWSEKIYGLDGFVIVTPEYNYVYPGQLKNAIDHVHLGWWYKPVAFVSYAGSSGGVRAVEQLRSVAVETRMVPVRNQVNIRLGDLQVDETGRPTDIDSATTAGSMIDQLLWWAQATKVGRTKVAPPGL
jgi:NAD(P)H-dependent FMN reductase